MNPTTLSQWQFAITSVYHFFFVPLTLGLSVLVAIMETFYVRTGQEVYKDMTKFWGKLFLINFAMGVVTGIVMEFQFGMNWAEYSRFVGDIFGAPLAVEALLAFFLESTFLGLWIFGWERLSKGLHAVTIWLVAIGSNVSAFWILAANSFMQHPVGYTIENGRAVMTNFMTLLTNPYVWGQFPHTVFSGFSTAAFFVFGISAYHLIRKNHEDLYHKSLRIAAVFGMIAIAGVILVGHNQAQKMIRFQPMKMAAAEMLMDSDDPADLSLFTIYDEANERAVIDIRIPRALSFLAYNRFEGKVEGIHELQAEYEGTYGPGDYSPSMFVSYWSFRIMVGLGFLMAFIMLVVLIYSLKRFALPSWRVLGLIPVVIAFPYLANSSGWILTEMGRQPWVVFGLMKTQDAVSPTLNSGMVLLTLVGFTLVYGILIVADIYLLVKYSKAGPQKEAPGLVEEA